MNPLRMKYQTIEFGQMDIHIKSLRNTHEYYDENDKAKNLGIPESTWALFGVIWDSSEVLARFLCEYDTKDKRILEVGCGLGLCSLMLNHTNHNITATDYHPEVETFLKENTKLNNDQQIPFVRTSWQESNQELGKFDLIIGSDILYERDHIELLSNFINNQAKKNCEVIIVDPNRGNNSKFTTRMNEHGFECEKLDSNCEVFKGRILKYSR